MAEGRLSCQFMTEGMSDRRLMSKVGSARKTDRYPTRCASKDHCLDREIPRSIAYRQADIRR